MRFVAVLSITPKGETITLRTVHYLKVNYFKIIVKQHTGKNECFYTHLNVSVHVA